MMPDVWSIVSELDDTTQARLAEVLETRAADPQQQAMRRSFLDELPISPDAQVLEVGCGTGALTRLLASLPEVARITGIDPAPSLLRRAEQLSAGIDTISFQQADGRSLPFESGSFTLVIFDSTLCHMPEPERALVEAYRVLRPEGILAVFDGDYATATVALGDHDPLQTCVDTMMANSVHDRHLVRRLPGLVQAAGFELLGMCSHGYVESTDPGYMLTVIDRGADMLTVAGTIDATTAEALTSEARRRVAEGRFFGHIAYASLIARKPES
jgi:ubiquinone/menaquinone biosynthesis C-methylase UbiE